MQQGNEPLHQNREYAACQAIITGTAIALPLVGVFWPAKRTIPAAKAAQKELAIATARASNGWADFFEGQASFLGGSDGQTNAEEPVDVDRGQVEGHLPTGSRARSAAPETLVHTEKELPEPGPDQDAACRSAFSRLSPSAFAAAQVGPTPGIARNRVGPFGNTSRKASTMRLDRSEPT